MCSLSLETAVTTTSQPVEAELLSLLSCIDFRYQFPAPVFLIIIFLTCPLTKQGFLPFQRICMIVEVQEEVLKPSSQFLVNGKLSLRQVLTPQHFKITLFILERLPEARSSLPG